MTLRLGTIGLIGLLFLLLGPVGSAQAELRSPPLTASCENNREYAEYVFGPWRVEGCTEEAEPQDDEFVRRRFFGNVELNGMIVEGNSPLIVTTSDAGGGEREYTIERSSSKLVLDPLIAGARRRIVMYSGELELSITATPPRGVPNEQIGDVRPPAGVGQVRAAAVERVGGRVDLPVSGVPALLGLRVRDQIEDAKVDPGDDNVPASIEFKPPTSLGSTASALLREWQGNITIKTIDGRGMTVDNLRFRIPGIELPPLGGFEDLEIRYSAERDEWSGSIFLDLGEPLFTLDLAMKVSASTGAPTRIEGTVDNLNIPIGNTGIFLQRISALFNNNPLTMGVGASATAGPEIAGVSLFEMSGDLTIRLELDGESNFRLEVEGFTRVLPAGAAQLATGEMRVIIDSNGFISVGGDARYVLGFDDLNLNATIGGSGAYSTTSDQFNIEAHANGQMVVPLVCKNGCDLVNAEAVVSDVGWGTCGTLPGLLFWVQGGVAQDWDRNPVPLVGCDLGPYESALVRSSSARAAGASPGGGESFVVPRGAKTVAVEATAGGAGAGAGAAEPQLELVNPSGRVVARSVPLGNRMVGRRVAVIAQPESPVQFFFLRNPAAGRWTVRSVQGGPQLTGVRVARDMPPLSADVSVARLAGQPGRRRLRVRNVAGLAAGEEMRIGLRTPGGVMPLGLARDGRLDAQFDELPPGRYAVVASVVRNGLPIPVRQRVIGRYVAEPPPPPRAVQVVRRGRRVLALARPRPGAEVPDAWQYVLRKGDRAVSMKRMRPGRPARFVVGSGERGLVVTARPVSNGRPLDVRPRAARVPAR